MVRNTKQRSIILEELKKVKSHPTADELYLMVKKKVPRISLGTVYRNLENLAEAGIILKLEYSEGQKRFDGNTMPHIHFKCTKCSAVEDIPFAVEVPDINRRLTWAKSREITGSRLEYFGLCANCKN